LVSRLFGTDNVFHTEKTQAFRLLFFNLLFLGFHLFVPFRQIGFGIEQRQRFRFARIIEDRIERVIIFGRNRVKFVIVAARTTDRLPDAIGGTSEFAEFELVCSASY
jgi:hypothetical protein